MGYCEGRWHHLIAPVPNSVYACGPITGQTFDEAALGWREKLYYDLKVFSYTMISPMRSKHDLRATVDSDEPLGSYYDPRILMSTPQSIVHRDFHDVARSAVVFAYLLDAERVSIGSMFEIAWCYMHHKPCVIVMEDGGLHDHPFVRQSGFVVPDYEAGLGVTLQILSTGL